MHRSVAFACIVACALSATIDARAATLSDAIEKDAVIAAMTRVADWQHDAPSKHAPTDWTKGALFAGMMEFARMAPSPKYHDAMLAMGQYTQWKLGRRPYHADDHCVGQTYCELFLLHRDPAMLAPMREHFDWLIANPKDDNLSFALKDKTDRWSWCDALFMAPPAWARLTLATGDRKYLDHGNRLWWVTSDYLYDKEEHLYFRDDRYFPQQEANGRKVFWSRGNGWVMGGLVRVIPLLPKDYPDRAKYVQQFKEMAAAVLKSQQPDGLWRSSLLDPESYPLKETSGTGFFTYALAWGVNEGLLDRATFEPAARKGWAGLVGCVRDDGKLAHVQPIGADPKKFDAELSEVYGVGAFLLAGSEIFRLAGGVKPAIDAKPAGAAAPGATLPLPAMIPGGPAKGATDAKAGEGRAYGRHVPERKDDFAWENDRIAFRMYGPALEAAGEISSGIDVWVKNVRKPVIDDWFKKADYHKDHGEGGDFYKVGPTCGCGGIAIRDGAALHFSKNWTQHRVIENGPDKVVFELQYAPWRAGSRTVRETKRITLEKGSNFNRIESRFEVEPAGDLPVAIGIVERSGDGRALMDKASGVLAYCEPEAKPNGRILCAVVANPAQVTDIVHATGHHLVYVTVKPGQPLVYFAGAGWSKGDFPTPKAWETYVQEFAKKAF
jgi:rhamnogalacturonyl hydrolase YesR